MASYITKQQMQKLDNILVEKYGIKTIQMMELAGFGTAEFCRRMIGANNKKIVVLAGTGNNGGDGIAAARFLHNWGADVSIFLTSQELKEHSLHHLNICKKIGIKIIKMNELEDFLRNADFIIDALLGYNIEGDPTGIIAEAIRAANKSEKQIISIDLPSGLDPNSGEPYKPCIKASYTLTLSLPKYGLKSEKAGKTYLLDLGVPDEALKEIGVEDNNLFASDFIIEIK